MTQTNLLFAVSHKYDMTKNDNLAKLSIFKFWDTGKKAYFYLFRVGDIKEVFALLGKDIEFIETELRDLITHCPNLKQDITLKPYKGVGKFEVTAYPKIYRIKTIQNKEEVIKDVPVETVEKVWEVIEKFELGEWVPFAKVSEKICKKFEMERFFRKTGSFDKQKFFGARSEGYFSHYYYPIKILEWEKNIEYSKRGMVKRVAGIRDVQTEFDDVEVDGE